MENKQEDLIENLEKKVSVPKNEIVEVKRNERNIASGGGINAIVPKDIIEVARFVDAFTASGMIPYSYEVKGNENATKARLMIGLMKSLEIGLHPITGINTIMIVNNKPTIWGDGAIALVQSKGVLEWMKSETSGTIGTDDYTCIVSLKRKGQEQPYVGKFSVADAKKAHLWGNTSKKPWMEYPERMLFNRARAFAIRDGFSDCLCGLAITEEMQDIAEEEKKNVDTSFLSIGIDNKTENKE